MKRMRFKLIFIVVVVFSVMLLGACGGDTTETVPAQPSISSATSEPVAPAPQTTATPGPQCTPSSTADPELSADSRFYPWIVYWDNETAISESNSLSSVMGSISIFAAYFNENDGIIFPQSSEDTLQIVGDAYGTRLETYLTFVNDIKYSNGKSSLKDTDLLRRLFSSQSRMDAHIDEIIALTKAKGCSGIEIDYENIKGDDALWQLYAQFLTALKDKAAGEGLKLRIVLETAALTKASFPAGPEYVIMLYNLYGNHSEEPGPKADEAFISGTAAQSVCLGPNVCFAFSAGGFDWSSSGEIVSLNESDAAQLAADTNSTPVRDPYSGALSFTYQNEAVHTVWYADGETLCFWIKTAQEAGIKSFAFWRLGGNSDESLCQVAAYLSGQN